LNPAAPKPSYLTLAQLFGPIRDDLKKVESEFARHVESQVPLIPAMGKYVQSGGGKRIRPAVLLMAARMSGYTGDQGPLFGAVIEFIHTATLVHDDIIDESEVRRGKPAVHAKWGNDVTVLLGDFLYIKSMSMALTRDSLDVIQVLCEVTLRMIEGEIYQLTKNGVVDLSEDEHLDIVRRKTAYLFAGATKIGAMLGPTTPEQQQALWDYGFNIGIAFQLVDDLLDYTGDEVALGKPVGGDLLEGKMTLPVIHLRGRDRRGEMLIRKIVKEQHATIEDWRELRSLLTQHRSIDYAFRRATEFVDLAKQALYAFPASPEREALMFLPDYVLSRDR
jgi:octaprenyl-diphosphate synthase